MTNCALCGEDLLGAGMEDLFDIGKESVYLCHDCRTRVDDNLESGKGKYIVDKCKACGHVKGLLFRKYKTRGRPVGSMNDPVKKATRLGLKPLF